VIYPRLCRALSDWKPTKKDVRTSLQAWILPWLPHLDYRSMLTDMFPDMKRKIRASLTHISRLEADKDFFRIARENLKPWVRIINKTSLEKITSECITPRLGRYLAKMTFSTHSTEQKWGHLDILFSYFNEGMISQRELLSLVEGEILIPLANEFHKWCSRGQITSYDAAQLYCAWKARLISPSSFDASSNQESYWNYLQNDTMICRIFYGYLLLIKAMEGPGDAHFDDLKPTSKHSVNYRIVQVRRAKEDRLREEEEEMRGKADSVDKSMNFHVSVHGKGGATFREVVEDFANHQGIPFHPKLGTNARKDGKTIFMFGHKQVYIDSNVVFTNEGDQWVPSSLSELIV